MNKSEGFSSSALYNKQRLIAAENSAFTYFDYVTKTEATERPTYQYGTKIDWFVIEHRQTYIPNVNISILGVVFKARIITH